MEFWGDTNFQAPPNAYGPQQETRRFSEVKHQKNVNNLLIISIFEKNPAENFCYQRCIMSTQPQDGLWSTL